MAGDTERLERLFPGLTSHSYTVTSPRDSSYNCVGWALNEPGWWWPGYFQHWPEEVERESTLDAFHALLRLRGFTQASDAAHEPALEKVAVYVDLTSGSPTHLARQLESGRWTSKIGSDEDIEHDSPVALEGLEYGRVALILARPRR